MANDGIKRCGFAAAGRACYHYHARRALEHQMQKPTGFLTQAQCFKFGNTALLVGYAQHEVFAISTRLACNAKIHLPPVKRKANAPVLRQAAFGDIHLGHNLESHRHTLPITAMQTANLLHHAVNPITHAQKTFFRLKVNIGCAALDGIVEKPVNQSHDRIYGPFRLQRFGIGFDFAVFNLAQDAFNGQFQTIIFVNNAGYFRFFADQRFHLYLAAQKSANLIKANKIVGVGNRDLNTLPLGVKRHRKNIILFGDIYGNARQNIGIHRDIAQIHNLRIADFRKRIANSRFGNKTEPHQYPPDLFSATFLFQQCNAKLIFAENAFFIKHFPERARFPRRA